METAGEKHFKRITAGKNYIEDIIRPMKLVSRLTQKGGRFEKVKQTTQFIVGASEETDREIVKYLWGLYKRLRLDRAYFSGYQRGLGEKSLPGELSQKSNGDILMREHRLYQVDWLVRKYGFSESDIVFDAGGNLPLDKDPKEMWAVNNPGLFPVNVNRSGPADLLKVPGFGHITVKKIMDLRQGGAKICSIEQLGSGKRLNKALQYVTF